MGTLDRGATPERGERVGDATGDHAASLPGEWPEGRLEAPGAPGRDPAHDHTGDGVDRRTPEPLLRESAELAAQLAELERRSARAEAWEREAHHHAEEAMKARVHLLESVSHELRTPLNGIVGYLDLLSQGIGGELTRAQGHSVERIRAGAARLVEMVEEILTFSRLEAGREEVVIEETDVCAAAREMASLVRPLMEEKGLAFEVHVPPDPLVLRTDGAKLRQILLNLLSNAWKYTERGEVRLAVEGSGEDVHLRVSDTGPGIPPEERERIFVPFQRLGGPGPGAGGGAGLGLSVSRALTTLLGGDLTVEGEPGEGSVFDVRLPAARGAPAPPPPREEGCSSCEDGVSLVR